VLRHVFKGKASIADPDGFKDKLRQLEKATAVKNANGLKKQKSMVSVVSKSQKSGRTGPSEDENDDEGSQMFEDDEYDNKTNLSLKMKNDPVLNGLSTLFEEMQTEIENRGQERFNYLNKLFTNPAIQKGSTLDSSVMN